jgi:hypothetical protein
MDETAVKGCVDAWAVWLAEVLVGNHEADRYDDYMRAWSALAGSRERRLVLALTREPPAAAQDGSPVRG